VHRLLEEILANRRRLVREALADGSLTAPAPPCGPIRDTNTKDLTPFVVAEVKRASPSRGPLATGVDAASRARAYERGGAAAVSVLCEPDYFLGSRDDVRRAAAAVKVPILCKDFIVDPAQLRWAREDGAAWVLLIARVLGPDVKPYVCEARALGLEPLVEVHTEGELDAAVSSGAHVIGINARDLDTFEVDLGVVERLAPLCPPDRICVAESGIRGPEDAVRLREAGARGFLIGESLMRAADPEGELRAYRQALGLLAEGAA
jgi:indole-3-glycerol phosphate synthase/phosphoribosylanthranilate isomerase/anthranilate synthase/indole-3-glycerol phosphate synthase/phosphoribosylanthranilate isomerase